MINQGDYVFSTNDNTLAEVVAVVEDEDAVVLKFKNGDMKVVDNYYCVVIEYPKLFEALDEYFAYGSRCLDLYLRIVNRQIQGLYVEDLPNVSDRAE